MQSYNSKSYKIVFYINNVTILSPWIALIVKSQRIRAFIYAIVNFNEFTIIRFNNCDIILVDNYIGTLKLHILYYNH